MKKLLVAVFLAGILAGCATGVNSLKIQNVNLGQEKPGTVEMPVELFQLVGVEKTPEIASGDFEARVVKIPHRLLGEWDFGRVNWRGWIVSSDNKETPVQILLWRCDYEGNILGIALIPNGVEGKLIIPATQLSFGYDAEGKEFEIDLKNFLANVAYRKKIAEEGSEISSLKKIPFQIEEVFSSWNEYRMSEGKSILSPLGEDDMRIIASVNPQFKFGEKLVGTGSFSLTISASPIGMAQALLVGVIRDAIRAKGAPSIGADYQSMVSRRKMGILVEWIARMYTGAMEEMHKANNDLFIDNYKLVGLRESLESKVERLEKETKELSKINRLLNSKTEDKKTSPVVKREKGGGK